MENKEFLLEEYKNKWAYVRHTEEVQNKAIQWFILIVGAILAFLFKDINGLSNAVGNKLYIIPLLFLVLYSASLNLLLLLQKKNYNRYTDRILELEKKFCEFELELPKSRTLTVFRLRYTLVTLVGAGCVFLSTYFAGGGILISTVTMVVYLVLFVGLSFKKNFVH
jgi:hypothetical protein